MSKSNVKVAIVGNPNSGKSSIFNKLTGLNQKIGNFPGVTVENKKGVLKLLDGSKVDLIDLPGTYSLHPKSQDEAVTSDILLEPNHDLFPDLVLYTLDASNMERSLLLYSQVTDLGFPTLVALNQVDTASKKGYKIDVDLLEEVLTTEVAVVDGRKGDGMLSLKRGIKNKLHKPTKGTSFLSSEVIHSLAGGSEGEWYTSFIHRLRKSDTDVSTEVIDKLKYREVFERYRRINQITPGFLSKKLESGQRNKSDQRIDRIVNHPVLGYLIFGLILFVMFQAIFAWAEPLMDIIDLAFSQLSSAVLTILPEGVFTSLLANGVIPGLGGVFIFIPQIALLFLFIGVLEETGYMSRAVFLMDRMMTKFGLNGKSIVPMISGMACAIPAVMAARTIDNWRDRLITIMVTPLMSCSARLPVYAIMIALVIPSTKVLGVFNVQGLVLTGLYVLGFVCALICAWVFKKIIPTQEGSFFLMELPAYKLPRPRNLLTTVFNKSKTFVLSAGKIILAISMVLWFLASYGPSEQMAAAEEEVGKEFNSTDPDFEKALEAYRLEHSYAGHLGKLIEPAIRPLGYDWKIGIGLIASFAAREVFVGTLATIYSLGDTEEPTTIKAKLEKEVDKRTGKPVFDLATGLSILIFYVFAMQCMSTLAVVQRETKSWKWPLIQLFYMTVLAYGSAFITYQIFA